MCLVLAGVVFAYVYICILYTGGTRDLILDYLGVHRQHRSVLRLLCNSGPVPDMPTFPLRIPRVWPLEHPFGRYRHHVSVTRSHATQVQGKRSNGGCAPTPHRSCTKKEQLPASPYLKYRTPRNQTRPQQFRDSGPTGHVI